MGKEATALYAEADGAAERPEITSFRRTVAEVAEHRRILGRHSLVFPSRKSKSRKLIVGGHFRQETGQDTGQKPG